MTDFTEPGAAISHRMAAILAELPALGKDQRNTQQGFMFRGHDQILNALNPLLAKHEVFVLPEILERIGEERATKSGGVMHTVHLHVRYRFHGPGKNDYVEADAWGEGTDLGDKATSKAMTMAFKSCLNQVFAISSEEFGDPDGVSAEETRVEQAGTGPVRPRNWQEIGEGFANLLTVEDGREWISEAIGVKYAGATFADLTTEQRTEAGELAAATLMDLVEEFAGTFPPPDRTRIALAFHTHWDGIALHGPPWRVGPDDPQGLPSYEEYVQAELPDDPAPAA